MNLFAAQVHPGPAGQVGRRIGLIISLLLVIAGGGFIRATSTIPIFPSLAEGVKEWSVRLYLGFEHPLNIVIGFALLAGGAALFAKIGNRLDLNPGEHEAFDGQPHHTKWNRAIPWIAGALIVNGTIMAQLGRHQYSTHLPWLWLGTLIVPSIMFWLQDRDHKRDLKLAVTYADGIWMLVLFAAAISTGSYLLNDLPAGWVPDEGAFWWQGMRIASGAENPPILGIGVFTFPIASSIFQAWVMKWAGINMWGWRFASVLPAALTVFPLYLLARDLFDRRVAIAACIIMFVNPFYLAFARLGYNNSQSLLPVALCIYLLAVAIRKDSRLYLWLAGLTAGLGFYTYIAAWLGGVAAIAILLSTSRSYRQRLGSTVFRLGIVTIGAFAVMLPQLLYGMSEAVLPAAYDRILGTSLIGGFYGRELFGGDRIAPAMRLVGDRQTEVFYDPGLYTIVLLRGLVRTAAALFDPLGYLDHPIPSGLAGPVASSFFVLGFGAALASFRKLRYTISVLWFLTGFIFLGALASLPPRPTHLVAAIPAMSLLSAVGLVTFLDSIFISVSARQPAGLWKSLLLAAMLLTVMVTGLFQYFFVVPFDHPANMDDYISWLGRQTPKPVNLILVDYHATTRDPESESRLGLTKYNVSKLTRADLEAGRDELSSWTNFIAILGTGREIAEQLVRQIPNAKLKMAYLPFNEFRGYIVTDLEIDTKMDLGFSRGIRDLWDSPARQILLVCAAGVLILGLYELKNRWASIHSKIARRHEESEPR